MGRVVGVPPPIEPRRLPETAAVLEVRLAVRRWLREFGADGAGAVAVALSGGADSLALTAAAVVEAPQVDALIVDHGLQEGSAEVAGEAARVASALGCRSARVLAVSVGSEGGMEAAARRARYAALDAARAGAPVLLGHTLDDQAETVLLGLARGSGGRSIRGMATYTEPWGRPLLGVRRAVTRALCADLALRPYEDPHNSAPEFTRVRVRHEVLPLLEDVLGGGVAEALARTASHLREDGAVLDALAEELLDRAIRNGARPGAFEGADFGGGEGDGDFEAADSAGQGGGAFEGGLLESGGGDEITLSVEILATAPDALRRRAIRLWLLRGGAKALTDKHLRAVDALVTAWRGQGGVAVGGGPSGRARSGTRLVAAREHGRLTLRGR
ncbi:tRNA lysidine(34) synthetase TilS [Nocardia bovistercoris]|uniref:tRNA(Ile)-lysidine synthase n=1 Tax=Nocardia bovistercoris TaxID=2785916 RepID=A0A931IJ68_9NOCA|nr:tRNA lysidine(34) synthetase TilS [Nocardia bovistercoris]MBH0781306.1 tRNA lysidine(34) synthetase TilS [Nocardia bovistercoris]